jgi:hypothetical protein
MGTIPCGFGASTNTQWLHLVPSSDPGFHLLISHIWINKCGVSGMMMVPYCHPQHVKVAKYHAYVLSGCGIKSIWFDRVETQKCNVQYRNSNRVVKPKSVSGLLTRVKITRAPPWRFPPKIQSFLPMPRRPP